MRDASKFYCPVDEKETGIKPDGTCEQCDSDLTPLLRLKALPNSYFEGALRFKEMGQFDSAIEKLIIAINMSRNHIEAIFELANLYAQKNMFDEAIAQYDRALAMQPGSEKILKAKERVEELRVKSIRKRNEQTRKISLFKKLAIATPLTAFLIGLSVIPISNHFMKQSVVPIRAPAQQARGIAAFQYTVKSSDCLELIAYRFYGDRQMWRKIYEANKGKMHNPNNLSIGQTIVVPIEYK